MVRLWPTCAKGSEEDAAEAEGPVLGFDILAKGSIGLELIPAAEKFEVEEIPLDMAAG